jgi:type II secretory pathway pseudopilin PulG
MKIHDQVTSGRWQVTGTGRPENLVTRHVSRLPRRSGAKAGVTGFTMVEIAICLAIIGVGLVAIIGVLPIGINVEKDNREETLIDQDATVFIENIRNGARGLDDLTNYVVAISNYWTLYPPFGVGAGAPGSNGYTYTGAFAYGTSVPAMALTNGANIIGLLSTPEFTGSSGAPVTNLNNTGYYSNYVVAYVRSLSGPAVEKPPQTNSIMVGDSFSYKMICGNTPVAVSVPPDWQNQSYNAGDQVYNLGVYWRANAPTLAGDVPTNGSSLWVPYYYNQQMTANLHELRLTFLWPLLPNGSPGNSRQTFRTSVAGQIIQTNNNGQSLYFFQPQFFTNAP